jgi:hypothetical protein
MDGSFRSPSELEDEGIPDHEGPLVAKHMTGDGQEGVAPPRDVPVASFDHGTTAEEQRRGEPLDGRLARELPDATVPYPDDDLVGRLVEEDEGARADLTRETVAFDVGADSGGFSAEEAAMHLEPET